MVCLLTIALFFSSYTHAGTLIIEAKKRGQHQELHMTHVHVADYGFNSAGTFIIRFENGEQQSFGLPSQWEYFKPTYINDNDQLYKP